VASNKVVHQMFKIKCPSALIVPPGTGDFDEALEFSFLFLLSTGVSNPQRSNIFRRAITSFTSLIEN
jgi:hypothetical protein